MQRRIHIVAAISLGVVGQGCFHIEPGVAESTWSSFSGNSQLAHAGAQPGGTDVERERRRERLAVAAANVGASRGSYVPGVAVPAREFDDYGVHRAGDDVPSGDGEEPIEILYGQVSFYHDSLAGNRTANGERYNPDDLTAASRTLPFGTLVRVVRQDNGESVVVRINDRGPFGHARRILDLSKQAARELGMLGKGVVDVRAEILRFGAGGADA